MTVNAGWYYEQSPLFQKVRGSTVEAQASKANFCVFQRFVDHPF